MEINVLVPNDSPPMFAAIQSAERIKPEDPRHAKIAKKHNWHGVDVSTKDIYVLSVTNGD